MNAKDILTSPVFCPMPWTGLMYNFDGQVKNCIRSAGTIGDIKTTEISDILLSDINLDTQQRMLDGAPGQHCHTCYDLERGKKRFDIVSDRIFYIREMKHTPLDTYRPGNHDLKNIDVRWTNLCNFACVYCGPEFSSRWVQELATKPTVPSEEHKQRFKQYIFDRAANLKHVYMAGGEPLLMKENLELLTILSRDNPDVHLRINTNLSKVDTRVFEKICEFKNVQWTVSMESLDDQFEYIRWGGNWQDFKHNLAHIQTLPHRINFNMLYFLLNHRGLFDAIDWLTDQGFHANSFVAGALTAPVYLNIRHLPDHVLQSIMIELSRRIDQRPGYLLEDSLKNIMHYIQQPFDRDIQGSFSKLQILDQRRGIDSKSVFPELYSIIEEHHGQTL